MPVPLQTQRGFSGPVAFGWAGHRFESGQPACCQVVVQATPGVCHSGIAPAREQRIFRARIRTQMTVSKSILVSDERRVWMRRRDHTVVFERDPEFARFLADPSGSVLHILRIWIACPDSKPPGIRHYVGSIRHCDCGGWMSHRELLRLFRRATLAARHFGESAHEFRARLRRFLREYFEE
jgi:hypothetical protein